MKLSVLIPVYNEKNSIKEILERVQNIPIDKQIVVVDDCSTDGTRELLPSLRDKDIAIVYHEVNQGKGAAIRTGILHASGDYVIVQDADLEYDPNDYFKLLKLVIEGKAKVVYGSRFKGKGHFSTLSHYLGNKLLTWITNILYGVTLTDMETCYKLIPTDLIKKINIKANKFDMEPEITAKILKRGYKIVEVPISYKGRGFEDGKKISWKDAFSAIWTLIKYRFWD